MMNDKNDEKKSQFSIGIPQWCYEEKNLQSLEAADSLNVRYIQIDLGDSPNGYHFSKYELQDEFLKKASDKKITVLAMALNDLCRFGFTKEEHKATAYETLRKGIEAARRMKIPALTIPNFFDNEIISKEDFNRTVEAFKYLCDLAEKFNIDIYTENVMKPDSLFEFITLVPSSKLKLLFDNQNYYAMRGYDPIMIFKQLEKSVDMGAFIHIKDGDKKLGSSLLTEGSGEVVKFTEILKQRNYQGTIFIENNYTSIGLKAKRNTRELIEKDILTLKKLMKT